MSLSRDAAQVRRFNRFYTRRIGLLEEHLHGSDYSLTEARVLYELAHQEAPTPMRLARDLGLDPAYLSRILARFRKLGLIETRRSESDRRVTLLTMTAAGRAAFEPLDSASAHEASAMLERLAQPARRDLLKAASTIQQILEAGAITPEPARLRDLRPGDLGWITHRQGVLYGQEYGWDIGYEALVAEILGKFVRSRKPDREAAWVAERNGEVVGSVFLVEGERPDAGQLRLLYVEPDARRLGIGKMLVDACVAQACAAGYRQLVLWTNDVLDAARRIYQAAGFTLVREERHHSFGKDLVGQTWSLTL